LLKVNLKRVFLLLIALCLTLSIGCNNQPEEPVASLGQQFSLAAGQSAAIKGEDLAIKFIEITADSRCPQGATCIWQGEVSSLVEITYKGSPESLTLTQPGLTDAWSEVDYKEYHISFNVEPYPQVDKQIPPADYRLQLTISR
jgi:hypothetical protein